jgi:pimeloyl-ACP methyl ester carboxylesterase
MEPSVSSDHQPAQPPTASSETAMTATLPIRRSLSRLIPCLALGLAVCGGVVEGAVYNPVIMSVDINGDQKINAFDQSPGGDPTSDRRPYRMWVNGDAYQDLVPYGEPDPKTWNESYPDDNGNYPSRNCDDAVINGYRDMDDMFPINIHLRNCWQEVKDGDMKIFLTWESEAYGNADSRTPSIGFFSRAFNGAVTDGSDFNFRTEGSDFAQVSETEDGTDLYEPSVGRVSARRFVVDGGEIELDRHLFQYAKKEAADAGKSSGLKSFIAEGIRAGRGALVISTQYKDRKVRRRHATHFIVSPIKDMYEMVRVSPFTPYFPIPHDGGIVSYTFKHKPPFAEEPSPEFQDEKHVVVFVHGFNTPQAETYIQAETFYKRLVQAGYRGKFAAFTWNSVPVKFSTVVPDLLGGLGPFNLSEYNALRSSQGLAQYIEDGRRTFWFGHKIWLAGHSQGNAVITAAVARYGMSADGWILMQGALPAGCFDITAPVNSDIPFLQQELIAPTPSVANPPALGYTGFLPASVRKAKIGKTYNYFHDKDFALVAGKIPILGFEIFSVPANWRANQLEKPELANPPKNLTRVRYEFDEGYQTTYRIREIYLLSLFPVEISRVQVDDPFEVMAFISRSRSAAVGTRSVPGFDENFDIREILRPQQEITDGQADHSMQFARPFSFAYKFYRHIVKNIK